MPNPYFKFKRFTVYHDLCAMKVGTDGVLLGTWTNADRAANILDVGAGSGLIGLILAQRYPEAMIDSIDIDESACMQANENYKHSPFDKISPCQNISLQYFVEKSTAKYDLIVSNPPFFNKSLKSPNLQRNTARHTDVLLIENLIGLSAQLLNDNGRIAFIFPFADKDYLISLSEHNHLYTTRIADVYTKPESNPKRVLIEFSKIKETQTLTDLTIETARHTYSPEFTELVKDFYLKIE